MTESELLEAFRQYRWADCWQQVRAETDDLLQLHFEPVFWLHGGKRCYVQTYLKN